MVQSTDIRVAAGHGVQITYIVTNTDSLFFSNIM